MLADVQMRRCSGMQISRRRGTRGMLLYIRIRAHAHARTFCILRRNYVHSALTIRFYLIINAFRCVDRWNFHLHGNCTRLMWRRKRNYGRPGLRDRERKSLVHPIEFSVCRYRKCRLSRADNSGCETDGKSAGRYGVGSADKVHIPSIRFFR